MDRIMQQLFNGVFLLEGEVGGRPLQLIYLRGDLASLLMDTGCAHDPSRFIVPQMRELDGDPSSLTWILNTHSDLDHIGGNHEMKQVAPRAVLACGEADRQSTRSSTKERHLTGCVPMPGRLNPSRLRSGVMNTSGSGPSGK
jgi:glyoxylase-like metal-dependent hydrolase (beta-lactamase superfamily II)